MFVFLSFYVFLSFRECAQNYHLASTNIRKMSKNAKSEKRREIVTFPSLFRMSTFVDCFRHLSIDAEFRFEFLKLPKYRDISL